MPLDVDNEESATITLSTMHEIVPVLPWHVSVSYCKAPQQTCVPVAVAATGLPADRLRSNRERPQRAGG